jgi:hypothetical protein
MTEPAVFSLLLSRAALLFISRCGRLSALLKMAVLPH